MGRNTIGAVLAIALLGTATPPVLAKESRSRHQAYERGNHDYRYRCKRSKGTTGLIVGGTGGAIAGNAVGGGVLGTVAGGVGGALLGKHIDKRTSRAKQRQRGC